MKLVTWNIQCGRGCDGRVDLQRIVAHARALADFDVLCLQEVSSNFPALDGAQGVDQCAQLAALLPGYHAIQGVAVDQEAADGTGRRTFGNLMLSRYPVRQVLRHTLPRPVDRVARSMPRMALEATLITPFGALRVMTTHLEYHSNAQRTAQVEALRQLHAQACAQALAPEAEAESFDGSAAGANPYHCGPHAVSSILTADFNFRGDDPLHARLEQPFLTGVPAWRDVWRTRFPNEPQPDTVGVYDRVQWPTPFACDFIFATEDLLPRLETVRVESSTDASDHQPVLVSFK